MAFDAHHPPAGELIDDCVHCGFCLPTCPTYELWHEEMDSPRGRIYLMRALVEGELPLGVTAKDVVLGLIGRTGISFGQGHLVEYRGSTMRGLSMEGRMTVCNMSIEWGAKAGMVSPDDTTFAYLERRPHAPRGGAWASL